ncbi:MULTISPECIES: metallophosphoesterase family protein [unclassified Rhizobium]|uniref:metallophosphoesterase family protein n=1 Tax=unclassified Rhizobium TaxID=2613769 RepID=UPI000714D363|nr:MULTISPECIES: DNA repair exonuclease [unclassified Rhizobium]KQS93891.1 serine/threonine protein phosphatase [Rhizobium sp. Leaf386]KQT06593.1 serine/threonine protein phosphatase [Rhizobium sp. Leaf391]KQU05022.1 serine/threonine protein phosphatase [Rhizobium sp. Leaf453]
MPFRFVHTADLHLDSPLRSLALKNAELADLVRGATRTALTRIIDLCIAESVDALLIAGDLYDGSQTSMNTALFLAAEMRRLETAGIRVFIIRGNHDSQSTMTRELTFPDNVHVFSGRAKSVLAKHLPDGRAVHIHGISFAHPHAPDSLLPSFQAPVSDAVNIGMLHTSLAGTPGHDPYAPTSAADLASHGFDYWALGHVHLRQVHSQSPLIVMPGMPQGRDINEAGPKTVTLVTVGDDGVLTPVEHAIGQAVFERLNVDLVGIEDWRQMLDAVGHSLTSLRSEAVGDHLIVRLRLTGATLLAWKLRRDPDFLLAELSNLAAGLNGCWIEKIDIECSGIETNAALSGPDPVEELASLIRTDVLTSHAFRQETAVIMDELLLRLPRDLRDSLAGDEQAAEVLAESMARAGSDDILAYLHGGDVEADR